MKSINVIYNGRKSKLNLDVVGKMVNTPHPRENSPKWLIYQEEDENSQSHPRDSIWGRNACFERLRPPEQKVV